MGHIVGVQVKESLRLWWIMCFVVMKKKEVKSEKLGVGTGFGVSVGVSFGALRWVEIEAHCLLSTRTPGDDLEILAGIPGVAHHYGQGDE